MKRAWGKVPYEERVRRHRRRLLDAAATLAAERGIAATSVADIVEQAGVSKRVFYEHFSDKEACFVELLREIAADHLLVGSAAADACAGGDAFESMRVVIAALMRYTPADPRLLTVLRAEARAGSAVAIELAKHRRAVAELLTGVAVQLGSKLPEDTIRLAALLLVHGVIDLRAELGRRRGSGVRDVATICCLAFGLPTA